MFIFSLPEQMDSKTHLYEDQRSFFTTAVPYLESKQLMRRGCCDLDDCMVNRNGTTYHRYVEPIEVPRYLWRVTDGLRALCFDWPCSLGNL